MDGFSEFCEEFKNKYPKSALSLDEPMRAHTSFRIGGRVRVFAEPESEEAMAFAEARCRALGIEALVVGRGSNLLVSDGDLALVCISTGGLTELARDGDVLICGAGVPLSRIAKYALSCGLAGFEFAHGIPGSLGGAVYMNAGAYGGEMSGVVESVRFLDGQGSVCEAAGSECGFGYRTSRFERGGTVLSARIRLKAGEPEEILARMEELAARRREKQPLNYPSAGSTFKRPQSGYAAAMIDGAGLKGARVGGAEVSEKHAGFIINRGGATFSDVITLMEHVQKTVFEKFGVTLYPEVKIVR